VDLRVVQEFLGHRSINTTLRYAHLAPKDLEKARDALQYNNYLVDVPSDVALSIVDKEVTL
jgi:integrase